MKRTLVFLAVALSSPAFAQMRGPNMSGSAAMQDGHIQGVQGQGRMYMGQTGAALVEGEVRKVDKNAAKLTVKHGAIPSMDMPPMTMVYRVKDSAMLDEVKASDNIRFSMEKIDGAFTVVKIERP